MTVTFYVSTEVFNALMEKSGQDWNVRPWGELGGVSFFEVSELQKPIRWVLPSWCPSLQPAWLGDT